jgi:flagellar protein FlaG
LHQSNKNLEFTVDTETEDPVVKLVDSETGDVIRQFPTEEALSIAKAIDSYQQGLLFKQEA